MSTKKPRADSKLKSLPPAQQEAIFELLRQKSYAKAIPLIREKFEVETSAGALSQFFAWYPLSRRFEQHADFADQLKGILAANPKLALQADQLSTIAQVAFETQAIQDQDSTLYMGLRKLRQKDADLALQSKNQDLRLRQYEEKIQAARANLERAKTKGGLDKSTLELIEQQLKLL